MTEGAWGQKRVPGCWRRAQSACAAVSCARWVRKVVEVWKEGEYELAPFPPERKAIDIGDYYSDFNLIKRELGWEPKTLLRSGLRSTLDYYSQNRIHYWEE